MINFIRDIETNYAVDRITLNGNQIWPYLRAHYFFSYLEKQTLIGGQNNPYILTFGQKVKMAPGIFWGHSNWLSRYNNIVLTSSNCRRVVNGKYFNIFIDQIVDEIGPDKFLTIETPAPAHFPLTQIHNKNAVSASVISLLSLTACELLPYPINISGESILKELESKYKLGIQYKKIIRRFNSDYFLYKIIFRRLKVKNLFLTCYYGKEAAIKAAHDLGIRVIEVQHGTIGLKNAAYNVFRKIDKSCFPDYLLLYGENDIEVFRSGQFINPEHVQVVGSFYIDYMKEHSNPIENYLEVRKRYKTLVGITLEMVAERQVIDFVIKAASLDKNICYIIIPRRINNQLLKLDYPENVIISTKNNFYQNMMFVDFHSAIYSTCALEAPSLGVQNILINIDNLSKYYYSDVLSNAMITRFVDTPEDYVKEINTFNKLDKNTIAQLNKGNIQPGYNNNIRNALNILEF